MNGALMRGGEEAAFGDAGYRRLHKPHAAQGPTWHVAMRCGLRRKLYPFIDLDSWPSAMEKMKAGIRARSSIRFA